MENERFIFWFWESPTTCWHACKVKKHFHFLTIYFSFLPYLLNDSQTIRSTIHFSKQLLCVMLICGDWLISFKAVFVKLLPLQKWHQVAKNKFAFSFRPQAKIKVCVRATNGREYAYVFFDINMKRFGICFKKTTCFDDSESTILLRETIYLYTVHFQI